MSRIGDAAQRRAAGGAARRLPRREALAARAETASGVVAAFVERQKGYLRTVLAAMESAMRRRLCEEAARLTLAGETDKSHDFNAAFARGFVLPLNDERGIIRSATTAQVAAAGFELLLVDGQVRVSPDPRPTMP